MPRNGLEKKGRTITLAQDRSGLVPVPKSAKGRKKGGLEKKKEAPYLFVLKGGEETGSRHARRTRNFWGKKKKKRERVILLLRPKGKKRVEPSVDTLVAGKKKPRSREREGRPLPI